MSLLSFKKTFILMISIFFFSNSHANEVNYEDWSGLYFPMSNYKDNKVKLPDFKHYNDTENNYILISSWMDKLILQSRTANRSVKSSPLKLGFFDSEIKHPFKREQVLIQGECKVKINLEGYKLFVELINLDDCNSLTNIGGEYVKYGFYEKVKQNKQKIPSGKLFLGKFYDEDICDKATQFGDNQKELIWSTDKDLKQFVDEAKNRELDCNAKPFQYEAYVLVCLWGKPQTHKFCEELRDTRGPYITVKECNLRVDEIIEEMPVYRPEMEPRGYRCDEV